MNREQAEEILDYLLEAARELDEARAAASLLGGQDKDAASLEELLVRLNSELLDGMFERFADLMPYKEFPAISSTLRWEAVSLPPSVSENDLDQIIFAHMTPKWQKVAMILWESIKASDKAGLPISDAMFAARIHTLVEADQLEGQGDLRCWRHSEVRLKDGGRPRLVFSN